MWYAIISTDVKNSLTLRMGARTEHVQRLRTLKEQGRLLIAGPHPTIDCEDPGEEGFSGSLIVAEFTSLDEAKTWADQDPYIAAGVYANVIVKPFIKVLP